MLTEDCTAGCCAYWCACEVLCMHVCMYVCAHVHPFSEGKQIVVLAEYCRSAFLCAC